MKVALVFPPFFYPNWFWDKGEDILVPPIPSLCLYSSLIENGIECNVFDITTLEYEKIKKLEADILKMNKEVEWKNFPKLDEYFKYRLTISTLLEGNKFELEYREILDKYVRILNNEEYNYVLFHVYDTTLHSCFYMSKNIKHKVVWGGHHILFLYYSLLMPPNTNRYKAYVKHDDKRNKLLNELRKYIFFYGEADLCLPSFLKKGYPKDNLEKPVMRKIINLNLLPKLKCWNKNLYTAFNTYMSRGCIYRCKFCDLTDITKCFRIRKPELALEEISESEHKRVAFSDFTITGNIVGLEKFVELCPEETQITSQATFNWSKKLTKLNQEKNTIHSLAFGVESEDNKLRALMNKGTNVGNKKILEILKELKKANIKVCAFWLVGYPGDDFEVKKQKLEKLLNFIDFGTIAIFNLGWYNDFALTTGDNITKKVELLPTDRILPIEEFLKYDYVFSDYPEFVLGFKYKNSNKFSKKVQEYKEIFENTGVIGN